MVFGCTQRLTPASEIAVYCPFPHSVKSDCRQFGTCERKLMLIVDGSF